MWSAGVQPQVWSATSVIVVSNYSSSSSLELAVRVASRNGIIDHNSTYSNYDSNTSAAAADVSM